MLRLISTFSCQSTEEQSSFLRVPAMYESPVELSFALVSLRCDLRIAHMYDLNNRTMRTIDKLDGIK